MFCFPKIQALLEDPDKPLPWLCPWWQQGPGHTARRGTKRFKILVRLPLPSVPDSLELQARGIRQEEAAEPQSIPGAWSEVQHEGDTNPGIWDSFGP